MTTRKNISIFILIIGTSWFFSLASVTWKVFFYMDSSDALSHMAIKNITDMMRGIPNNTVDFVIQLHAYYAAGLRYRVTSEGLVFLEETAISGNSKQDFIDAACWAFANNNADYTMLIASNHGWGILDPQWNSETQQWEAGADALSNACTIKPACFAACAQHYKQHKGFMFNLNPRTYLNNQGLIDSLAFLKTTILNGKQLDILAFDACMGDMFEIGYHVAPYARYLVGNQSCSLSDGFDYQSIMGLLNQGLAPRAVAAGMVSVFDAYYNKHDDLGIYTHAALDLSHIYNASKALDVLVIHLLNMPELVPLLIQACDRSPRFCLWSMYTDLIAFCKCLEEQLATVPPSHALYALQAALEDFYATIQPLIIARCGGASTHGLAYGVAIYLPLRVIDDSYCTTIFSRKSQWINLLKLLLYSNVLQG